MTVTTIGLCDICNERGPIVHALVAWKSEVVPFGDIDRCEDRNACRARIAERGDEWPLRSTEDER